MESVPWSSFSYLHGCSSKLPCLEPAVFKSGSSNTPVIQVLWTLKRLDCHLCSEMHYSSSSSTLQTNTLVQWEYLPGLLEENNVELNWFLYLKPKLYQCFKIPTSGPRYDKLGSIWCLHCWHDFRRQGTEFCDYKACIALLVHCKGITYN